MTNENDDDERDDRRRERDGDDGVGGGISVPLEREIGVGVAVAKKEEEKEEDDDVEAEVERMMLAQELHDAEEVGGGSGVGGGGRRGIDGGGAGAVLVGAEEERERGGPAPGLLRAERRPGDGGVGGGAAAIPGGEGRAEGGAAAAAMPVVEENAAAAALLRGNLAGAGGQSHHRPYKPPGYVPLSLLSAFALIYYALRTRGQYYLALVYLTTSKLSYVVLGNATVATTVFAFRLVTSMFLSGGLRPAETEAIGEQFRWNVTETCLALTIFRSEMDLRVGLAFLVLVLGKCLHWAVELREGHLRMTEETFRFPSADDELHWTARTVLKTLSDGAGSRFRQVFLSVPRIRLSHVKFVALTQLLLVADVAAVSYCALSVAKVGASVHILFGFEGAILAVSALSVLLSYQLHFVDGTMGVLHHYVDPPHRDDEHDDVHDDIDDRRDDERKEGDADNADADAPPPSPPTKAKRIVDSLSHSWRDVRATLTFAVELLAQSAKFLFYLLFFAIVFTYYGMPINIFREVYVSYQNLRRRLAAFHSYRRLTHNMNERFESVTSDEELDEAGRTCIICRERMEVNPPGLCKKLPGCGHVFHRSCLREWLVQQQTCPTCRGDIQAMEARVKAEKKRKEEEEKKEREEAEARAAATVGKEEEAGGDGTARAEGEVGGAMTTPAVVAARTVLPPAPREETAAPARAPSGPSALASTAAFPCLYRVTTPGGAPVSIYEEKPVPTVGGGGSDATTVTTTAATETKRRVTRTVPAGMMIVCTEMKWIAPVEEEEDVRGGTTAASSTTAVGGVMLKMPDGWVSDWDVERLVPVAMPPPASVDGPSLPSSAPPPSTADANVPMASAVGSTSERGSGGGGGRDGDGDGTAEAPDDVEEMQGEIERLREEIRKLSSRRQSVEAGGAAGGCDD